MNVIICFLTVFHVLRLIERRIFVPKTTRRLIYLGIFLPLADYILRIFLGELWFFSGNLVFHSFIYHGIFWSVVALLYWVYSRDPAAALRFYFPLAGLFVYWVFSVFSTEHLCFFAPLSDNCLAFDWIGAGYIVPMIVALFFWSIKRWSEMSTVNIARISLSVLVVFIALAGIVRYNARSDLTEELKNGRYITILPANILQTEWNVTSYYRGEYLIARYHFAQGWIDDPETVEAFNEFDIAQTVLLDPSVHKLYRMGFKNPIVNVEIQNEILSFTITESKPSAELMWLKEARIIKNRSGQIMDFTAQYGTVI